MTALRVRDEPPPVRTGVERLLAQMREANERLLVTALRAQHQSDEAHAEATRTKAELEDLMRRLLTLQDEERRRLALDLHDSTAQCLAALTMNLDIVERAAAALDARARRALAESRALAERCSREVRTLAYLLHPPLLDERGLPAAVRWFVDGFTKRSGIEVRLDLHDVGRLPRPVEIALFRVVQEGLTNVHRHASATTASMTLTATADAVTLDIEDQGRGRRDQAPAADSTGDPPGVGIQGMRERIRQLGGTCDVAFTDTGTAVRVRVPLHGDVA